MNEGREVYAFTSPGDEEAQAFARSSASTWAGGSDEAAARAARRGDHFRAGRPSSFPKRSSHVAPGGIVVCAGIHMSDMPSFPYRCSGRSACCVPSRT